MSIEEAVAQIRAQFADGFQLSDLLPCIRLAWDEAQVLKDLDHSQRVATVLAIVERVVDETDAPGPDWIVDRAALAVAHAIVPGLLAWIEERAPGAGA